jgi:hypothetical protein
VLRNLAMSSTEHATLSTQHSHLPLANPAAST